MIRKIVVVLFAIVAIIAAYCMLFELATGKLPIPDNKVDWGYVQKSLVVFLGSTIIAGVLYSDYLNTTSKA